MFGVDLPTIWFVIIAFLFAGYFLLEGFDFGVGMLLPFAGKDESRRAAMVRTIGPVWDGNEVWLITAGGALFAAFPAWYADMFSGYYLPLFLILVALIVRVVGLEWRSKVDTARWRSWCDAGIIIGSWAPPILWGVAMGNLIRGVPDNAGAVYPLFNLFGFLGAAAFVTIFLVHGITFLRLKTAGALRDELARYVLPTTLPAVVLGGGWVVWMQLSYGKPWTWIATVVVLTGLIIAAVAARAHRDGAAFVATSAAVLAMSVAIFGSLFPRLWPGLDVYSAASSHYTLVILTWAAAIGAPAVMAYQGWTYWVFRKRVTAEPVAADAAY